MLFKLWQVLHDLLLRHCTFETVLNDFVLVNTFLVDVMENINYYHKCLDNTKKKPPTWVPVNDADLMLQQSITGWENIDPENIEGDTMEITDVDIE